MNSKNIECFIALAETKNFAMVANQLYLSPSSVSYQIKKLEEELGFNLFIRNTHTVELTDAGKYYLQEIKKILSTHESIRNKAVEIDEKKNYFYVGLTADVSVYHYAYLLEKFHEKYPNVRLIPVPVSFQDGVDPLTYRSVDIMFTYSCRALNHPELKTIHVNTSHFYCAISLKDELSKRDFIEPQDLNHHTLITASRENPWIDNLIKEIEKTGGNVKVKDVEYAQLAVSMVKENQGVAFYPYQISVSESSNLRYVPIRSDYSINRILAWRAEDKNEMISAFCDIVKSRFK